MRPRDWKRIVFIGALMMAASSAHAGLTRGATASYHLEFNQQYAGRLVAAAGGYWKLQQGVGKALIPLTLSFDPTGMSTDFLNWLKSPGDIARLAVVRVDPDLKLVDRLEVDAFPVGMTVPAIVGATPKPVIVIASFTISWTYTTGGGAPYVVPTTAKGSASTPVVRVGNDVPLEIVATEALELTFAATKGWSAGALTLVVPHDRISYYYAWYDQSVVRAGDAGATSAIRPLLLRLSNALGPNLPFVEIQNARLATFEPFNDPTIGKAVKVSFIAAPALLDWGAFGK